MSAQDDVCTILSDRPGTFGVYARNLSTGETVEVNADRVLPTESAAKTFILLHYAKLVANGELDPARRVKLQSYEGVRGSGVLRFLAPGLEPTLDDLAFLMIIVSDNLATHVMLGEVGGADAVNATTAALGLATARVNPAFSFTEITDEPVGTSTPRDLAEAYTHIDDRCRQILFRQCYVDFLPRRLPHSSDAEDIGIHMPVRVFNKTGWGFGTCIDSALFETDAAAWVVAAMASDQTDLASRADDSAPAVFAAIGAALYEHWGP